MERSTVILPSIDWQKFVGSIVWLDYDGSLEKYMFEDLSILASNLKPGSFVIITCNGTLTTYKGKQDVPDLDKFRKDFDEYVPLHLSPQDLHSINASKTIRRMFIDCINREFESINAPFDEQQRYEFVQLFNLCYQDNSRMFTFGGFISFQKDLNEYKSKTIFNSQTVQLGEDQIEIKAPIITNKEIDLMNKHLPCAEDEFMDCIEISFIPEEFRRSFYKYYRQFPNFMEVS